jgi:ABC-type phosphonate transport system ATPase subunit
MDLRKALGISLTAALAIDRAAELLAEAERERLRRAATGSTPRRPVPGLRAKLPVDGRLGSWLIAGAAPTRHEA